MENLKEQIWILELKVSLLTVIIDLLEDDRYSKEEAALQISKILDCLSADTPALTFEQMIKGKGGKGN